MRRPQSSTRSRSSAASDVKKSVEVERYGVTVAMVNNRVVANRLEDIAGKTRNIPEGCELLTVARRMGVSLG